jgi:hypothetical protein
MSEEIRAFLSRNPQAAQIWGFVKDGKFINNKNYATYDANFLKQIITLHMDEITRLHNENNVDGAMSYSYTLVAPLKGFYALALEYGLEVRASSGEVVALVGKQSVNYSPKQSLMDFYPRGITPTAVLLHPLSAIAAELKLRNFSIEAKTAKEALKELEALTLTEQGEIADTNIRNIINNAHDGQ